MMKDSVRNALHTYLLVMIDHSLTLDQLQSPKYANDWSYLQSVNVISQNNKDGMEKVKKIIRLREDFETFLTEYTQLNLADSENKEVTCQVCL